jgi:hypothetical protein
MFATPERSRIAATGDVEKDQLPAVGEECESQVIGFDKSCGHTVIKVALKGIHTRVQGMIFGPPQWMESVQLGDLVDGAVAKQWGKTGLILEMKEPYLEQASGTGNRYSKSNPPTPACSPTSPAEAHADLLDLGSDKDANRLNETAGKKEEKGQIQPPVSREVLESREEDKGDHLMGITTAEEMLHKTVHMRVTAAGEPGRASLVSTTQIVSNGAFVGPVKIQDIPWAAKLQVHYIGLESALTGDYIARGKVAGFVADGRKLIVNCHKVTGPVIIDADEDVNGTVSGGTKVRMWSCHSDIEEVRKEEKKPAEKPAPPPPLAEEQDDGAKDRNVRQKTDATAGLPSSPSRTAPVPPPSGQVIKEPSGPPVPPPATSPSPTSYESGSSATEDRKQTEVAKEAASLPQGLRPGEFVHVVTLEEMNRLAATMQLIQQKQLELQEQMTVWATRKSQVGLKRPTGGGGSTGSGGGLQHQ